MTSRSYFIRFTSAQRAPAVVRVHGRGADVISQSPSHEIRMCFIVAFVPNLPCLRAHLIYLGGYSRNHDGDARPCATIRH